MIYITPAACSGGEVVLAILNRNTGSMLTVTSLVFGARRFQSALETKKMLAQAFADREDGLEASGDLEFPEDAV